MNRLLVIGSLNMDFLIEVEKMPVRGETILGKTCSWVPGGKGANQSFAAGRLGGAVSMIGAVGADEYGDRLKRSLNSAGVNLTGIEEKKEHGTGKAFVMLEDSGENRIIVIPGANSSLKPELIDRHEKLMDACDAVLLQLEIPMEAVLYAAVKARMKGKRVILDPSPPQKAVPDELLQNVDVIKPNETELECLTGIDSATVEGAGNAAEYLIKKGVKTVVATLGDRGALVVTSDYCELFPARRVSVVDTTAAGDSFLAAFSLTFNGSNYREAVNFANRVAEKVVQKKGAQSSIPGQAEMMEFMPHT